MAKIINIVYIKPWKMHSGKGVSQLVKIEEQNVFDKSQVINEHIWNSPNN